MAHNKDDNPTANRPRRRAGDAVRSANGPHGPVDSRFESGNRRGNGGRRTNSKSFIMNDL